MALAGGLARTGFPFIEYSFSGCAPTPELYPETHGAACSDWVKQTLQQIEKDPSIETVIIAARWAFYTEPRFDNGRGGRDVHADVVMKDAATDETVSDLRVRRALNATIVRLHSQGRRVMIYYPGPTFGWNIEKTLARSLWRAEPVDLTVPRRALEERQAGMRQMLDSIQGTNILRYDPLPRFCDADTCRPIASNGVILLDDQDHLSRKGADMIATDLLRLLNAELIKAAK